MKAKTEAPQIKQARYAFRNRNTDEQKAEIVKRTVQNEPKNYILLKTVFLEAHKLGIPQHRVMKAMGGHRGLKYEPLNQNWVGVYYKRSWWLPKACLKDLPKLTKIVREPKAEKKIVAKPAKIAKPKPKAEPEDMVMPLSGPKAGTFAKPTKKQKAILKATAKPTVRDSKGKVVAKADPKDIPGVPVVLKKIKKEKPMTADQAIEDLGFAPEPKTKTKLSTTRTKDKPKTKVMKRTVNEAGIPVMELVEQEA